MKKITFCSIILTLVTLSLCAQDPDPSDNTPVTQYRVTFQSTWNSTDHTSIPSGAHWSNLVGATHKFPNEFLQLGQNATTGIKDVAELGSNGAFNAEVVSAMSAGNADMWINQEFSPNNATSSIVMDIFVTNEHHYLTLVSMLAPSPDWFIAINSLDLMGPGLENADDIITLDVFAYDAGTDAGTDYTSLDSPISPIGISMLNIAPINGNKIGTLTVERFYTTLSTPNFEASKTLKIAPNPSKGRISITGDNVTNLESVKVYNILGSLVKNLQVNTTESTLNLDLSALNKGIYLVKLNTKNGETTTQKLIIE